MALRSSVAGGRRFAATGVARCADR